VLSTACGHIGNHVTRSLRSSPNTVSSGHLGVWEPFLLVAGANVLLFYALELSNGGEQVRVWQLRNSRFVMQAAPPLLSMRAPILCSQCALRSFAGDCCDPQQRQRRDMD
jgi:hypothetical protein